MYAWMWEIRDCDLKLVSGLGSISEIAWRCVGNVCWDLGEQLTSMLEDESEFSQVYGSTSARVERTRERA